jgi:hypothetical protein
MMERIVTVASSRFIKRRLGNYSSETSTGSLGKGIGGTSSGNKGSSTGSDDDTSDNTSGNCGNYRTRESANSSSADIATFSFSVVASRNGTVVASWADNVENETTLVREALVVVADIGLITSNVAVDARESEIGGQRIARIDGTHVVIVTNSLYVDCVVVATIGNVARIDGTSVIIITSVGAIGPVTEVVERINSINNTRVRSTHVEIVTIGSDQARWLGRAQIGEGNVTGGGVASVTSASSVQCEGLRSRGTSGGGGWVTRIDLTHVGSLAVFVGISALRDIDDVGHKANIDGTRILIIAVGISDAIRNTRTQVGVVGQTGGSDASVRSTSSVGGKGLLGASASGSLITGVSRALITTLGSAITRSV